jgi:predicted NBD/HSP70 family sugar kinase
MVRPLTAEYRGEYLVADVLSRHGPKSLMRRINSSAFQVARRATSREINRQIALNLVREKQPISRAELARVMGMRRGAVSLLVNQLLESGQVFEGAKGESKRGRRPTHLYIDTRRSCTLAVDISASRTSMLLMDALGHPLGEVTEFPTRRRPAALVKALVAHMGPILSQPPARGQCVGIGVAVSGIVDLEGRLKYSPTLGWRDVDLVTPLRAATGLPVVIENSVKACILAQIWAVTGDLPADGPVVFVNISDGVGVGIGIDGKLLRGAHNVAGEFGHVPLNIHGPACSCGQRGCWEAYVSKRAITARYVGSDPGWTGVTEPGGPTVREIVARARGGEGRALETLRETAYYIGRGFSTLIKSLDPRRVYVGGEITLAWDLVEKTVREALREQALIPETGETEIRVVPLGENPRLRGAAALVSAPAFAAPIIA